MLEIAIAFLTDNAVVLGSAGAVGGLAVTAWAIVKSPFRRDKPVTLAEETIQQIKPPELKDSVALTAAEFIRIRRELKADLEAEFAAAQDTEKAQLRLRIDELERQIKEPDEAFKAFEAKIADLEARLAREGSEIGEDRLAEARAAFAKGDLSVADDIFADIEARQEIEVRRAARAAFGRGEVAEAEVRWLGAAEHYQKAARLDPTYDTLIKAGELLLRAGRHAEAVHCCEQLVELSKAEFGGRDAKTAAAMNNLAGSYHAQGRFDEAELLYREALEIGREALGDRHPDYATRLNNLAGLLQNTGRFEEAEPLYREAAEIRREVLGDRDPDYAQSLNNLAALLSATGRFEAAEPLYREALEIGRAVLGDRHPDYAVWLNNLAGLLGDMGRFEEAEPLFREAVEVFEAALGPDHPHTKGTRQSLEALLKVRDAQ